MDVPDDPTARGQLGRSLLDLFARGDFDALGNALGPSPRWFDEPLPAALAPDLPLMLAIQWSPIDLIDALLAAGANPNALQPPGLSPLFHAISMTERPDHLAIVEMLIAYGADPDGRTVHNWTPLHRAVIGRNASAIELLLAAGADAALHSATDLPSTPLDMARHYGFAEGIELLTAKP